MEFKLRPWQTSDLHNLVRNANNPNVAKNMTDKFPHPYTAADASAFIGFANSQQPVHIFAIDIGGEAVGGIGIHRRQTSTAKTPSSGIGWRRRSGEKESSAQP